VKVHVRRLDALARVLNFEQVDLMKVDVEGAELDVLKGSEQLFITWTNLKACS